MVVIALPQTDVLRGAMRWISQVLAVDTPWRSVISGDPLLARNGVWAAAG